MNVEIRDLAKADVFASLFQHIKLFTEYINIIFEPGRMYIQAMDTSRVSIFEIHLPKEWFDSYQSSATTEEGLGQANTVIGINAALLFKVLNARDKTQMIHFYQEGESFETLYINLTSETSDKFNLHFEIPLIDIDMEHMHIPEIDYNAEFSLPSAHFSSLIHQLKLFGDCLDVHCSEESIILSAKSPESGKMSVSIKIDELSSFTINEDETLELSFGLTQLHNICLYSKLTKEVAIYLSDSYPIKMVYGLGQENAKFVFYLAPKIRDDDDN
jgi:proliferating cell nuclear antigen